MDEMDIEKIMGVLQRIEVARILIKRIEHIRQGAKEKHTDDYRAEMADMLCDQLEQGKGTIRQLLVGKINHRIEWTIADAERCADDCDKAAWQAAQLKAPQGNQ